MKLSLVYMKGINCGNTLFFKMCSRDGLIISLHIRLHCPIGQFSPLFFLLKKLLSLNIKKFLASSFFKINLHLNNKLRISYSCDSALITKPKFIKKLFTGLKWRYSVLHVRRLKQSFNKMEGTI